MTGIKYLASQSPIVYQKPQERPSNDRSRTGYRRHQLCIRNSCAQCKVDVVVTPHLVTRVSDVITRIIERRICKMVLSDRMLPRKR